MKPKKNRICVRYVAFWISIYNKNEFNRFVDSWKSECSSTIRFHIHSLKTNNWH